MTKRVDIQKLSIKKLKIVYTKNKCWKIDKENEFPLICLLFFMIQDKKCFCIKFNEFLSDYSITYNEEVDKGEFLVQLLTFEFKNIDEEFEDYKNENTNIIKIDEEIISDLNLLNYEKIFHFFNSESYFNKVNYFENLFYLIADHFGEIEHPKEEEIINVLRVAFYYYEYMYRFIELPIALHDIQKIEIEKFDDELILQILVLYEKSKNRPNFKGALKNFFYLNILYDSDIKTKEYEDRKRDIKRLLHQKYKNGKLHPQLLAEDILINLNKPLYNRLKEKKIDEFISDRLIDIKQGYFTRKNTIFIFFLIDFGLKILYNIDNWFNESVFVGFKGKKLKLKIYNLPTIVESGINEWCVIYKKKNENSLEFEPMKMFFSYKKNSFVRILTKYFKIIKEINKIMFTWKSKSYEISDFLNEDLTKYKKIFDKVEEEIFIQETVTNEVENEKDNYFIRFKKLAIQNFSGNDAPINE